MSYPCLIHVSINILRVLMHTNFMPICMTNHPSISYQAHTNSSILAHNIHITCMFTPFMFKIEQTSQSSNQQQLCKETSRTYARSCSSWEPSLKREEWARSSCRLSLRRDCEQRSWKISRALA